MNDEFDDQGITTVRKKPRKNRRHDYGQNGDHRNGASEDFDREPSARRRNGHHRDNGNDGGDWNGGRSSRPWEEPRARRALPYNPPSAVPDLDEGFKLPFDPIRLLMAFKRKWLLIFGATAALAAVGFFLGTVLIKYNLPVNLYRRENYNAGPEQVTGFRPREYSEQTLYGFMRSPEVARRVALASQTNALLGRLKLTPNDVAKSISIKNSPNPDTVTLIVSGKGNLPALVELGNLYALEVVNFTKDIQSQESSEVSKYLQTKITALDKELDQATAHLQTFNENTKTISFEKDTEQDINRLATLTSQRDTVVSDMDMLDMRVASLEKQLKAQSPVNNRLQSEKDKLRDLKLTYTEAHPLVEAQIRKIKALEEEEAKNPGASAQQEPSYLPNSPSGALYADYIKQKNEKPILERRLKDLDRQIEGLSKKLNNLSSEAVKYAMLKKDKESLEITRQTLAAKQRDAQTFTDNALGYFKLYADATLKDIDFRGRQLRIIALAIVGGSIGLILSLLGVLLSEVSDTHLKTAADVSRVTRLPVLASLGDLTKMDANAQVNWAFRTLTVLRGKLNCGPNKALVCGIISSRPGEGRSTWVNLLVSAASQRGLRVLTVDTRPTAAAPAASSPNPSDPVTNAMTSSVLQTPTTVSDQLTDPNSQPVVHIPLPGWVWNLERRKQWHYAMDHWRKIENLVIFVELPPACQAESVLLAENLPQLIWLVGSGMADAAETVTQLDTLRHAGCNLVGAVLNHEPAPLINNRISRWFTRAAATCAILSFFLTSAAAAPLAVDPVSPITNATLTATTQVKRAPWQERLTLGPGDVVDIHFMGAQGMNGNLSRTNIFVGPDGRMSYLEAQSLYVTGLTIEELRDRLDKALTKFYPTVRTIVIPVAFNSKKYYMLGKVNGKGVYPLDRPLTIVEAVARAKGLETGLYQRSSVELADLSRSFIIRDGQKLDINFQKLFLEGDLSQNIMLQPNDYVYFASTGVNEIYVLGEVLTPGPIGFVPDTTLLSVLTDRGGFTPRAYKKKALVVRGSLNEPETFVVNADAILNAREPDFKLQPGDIIYISARPWIKVEELLDDATSSFIQGAVTAWTGANIGPIIKHQLLPTLH